MTPDTAEKILFTAARTHRSFTDKAVETSLLHELYELVKFFPTASNLNPMRVVFVTSELQKQLVADAAAAGNKPKIESAAVVAIIARDQAFHQHVERLAPHMNAEAFREQDEQLLDEIAHENCWLQAGAFIAAARLLGLDCGPMSGFDKQRIDADFFADSSWRSEMLINLGYGDKDKLYPRGERLHFDEACLIL